MSLKNRTCITDFAVDMILPLIYKKLLYAGTIRLMLCFDVKHLIKNVMFLSLSIYELEVILVNQKRRNKLTKKIPKTEKTKKTPITPPPPKINLIKLNRLMK